jgi:RecB family exonuclease
MRIWDAVTEAYDATRERRQANVSDVTDLVDAGIDETPENLTFYGDTTDVESAIDDVLAAARDLRDGDLSPKSPATIGVASELGDLDRDRTIGHEHSYSSLDVFGDCPRRHALDYVIGAIADPPGHVSTPAEGTRAPSQRKVGDLFHHVAEAAYWRDYADDRSAWNRACGRIASVHDYDEDVVAAARTCVDRYFDSEVVADDWTLTAVEVPFELDTAVLDFDVDVDATVTGQIDAIYEDADGHLIVVDYKTTADERRLRDSYQLALYTLAADYHYDFTPWKAGYLVLGTPDPRLLLFDESDLRSLVDPLAADLEAVETATLAEQYDSPDPGPYCRHCDHRSLGCAPDRFDPS